MISIVLVHYNAGELLLKAVQSVLKFGGLPLEQIEFVIIDNSQNLDRNKLIHLNDSLIYFNPGYNSGFARAVNMGLREAKNDCVCLMNQDACFTEENTLLKLLTKLNELPEKTVLGCSLVDEDDKFQESVWIDDPGLKREWRFGAIHQKLNPNWKREFEEKKRNTHQKEGFVHRINGAFLLIPKSDAVNLDEILFDEDFFLYGEDVEWALRIKKSGWRFYHTPNTTIMHIGSASSSIPTIKTKQIIISDWLVIKRAKGNFYLTNFFLLLVVNKILDAVLLFFAVLRKKTSLEFANSTKNSNNIHFECLKKFALIILFSKKFSKIKTFKLNLYQHV